jgi:hypothetical protein
MRRPTASPGQRHVPASRAAAWLEFSLRHRAHGARMIEQQGARARRALIERKDE